MSQENTQAEQKDCQVAFVSNIDRRDLTFVCVGFALQLSPMLVRLALIQFISTNLTCHVVLFNNADMSCGYSPIEIDRTSE